jgi:two-component system nitrate/nitrite response regulator NarL
MNTFIIADDHPVTLMGMKSFIEAMGHIVLKTYDNGFQALNNILRLKPTYAIIDLNMPGMNGLEVLEKIRAQNKTIKVIIYTMYHERNLYEKALLLGVNGYLLKDFVLTDMEMCLAELSQRNHWFSPKLMDNLTMKHTDQLNEKLLLLTPSERKIISLIAQSKKSKEIADMLYVSEKTIENHRSNIVKKMGLSGDKNSLIHWVLENKDSLNSIKIVN